MNDLRRCLIVDDDRDDQEIFLMCLKNISNSIDCLTANNGVVALELFELDKEYIPDFIFLDVNMPKMNGVECLKQLKLLERLKETKIFMYSTTSEHPVVNECLNHGANDFLKKPSKISELENILAKVFHNI